MEQKLPIEISSYLKCTMLLSSKNAKSSLPSLISPEIQTDMVLTQEICRFSEARGNEGDEMMDP